MSPICNRLGVIVLLLGVGVALTGCFGGGGGSTSSSSSSGNAVAGIAVAQQVSVVDAK
ncbi:hypothetical protein [Andreprevotia chitinilytica]|uniref:hypothetical protein n=1 Tax=Andreprevotia chitinilytica TaxID=396808 RepID=UPI0012EC4CCC|nr:hypothetical protein [Andreprevotia chitinilytica]